MVSIISIAIKQCISIVVYILSIVPFLLHSLGFCFAINYLLKFFSLKKIRIEVNHAGNQNIPEFYDNYGNKKCISFEIPEDSTIGEVKNEIAKQVKYVDRSISLFKKPFGKKLLNSTNIICFHNTDPLYLYIVIPNY